MPKAKEITEKSLSKKLGICKDYVTAYRKESLEEGVDWKKAGRVIVYTPEAVERLMGIVGMGVVPPDEKKALTREPERKDKEEILTVVKHNLANKNMMVAQRANGEIVRVRVRTAKNFLPNMTFPATREKGSGVWLCTRSLPRWLGKW